MRVEGTVERLTADESQVYFDTRARGSRIGAWASQQTKVLVPKDGGVGTGAEVDGVGDGDGVRRQADGDDAAEDDGRAELEAQVAEVAKRFEGQDKIPVPPFWGGLRIIPDMFEFWQGRDSRLHDRFRYTKVEGTDEWKIERLSP